MLWRAPSPRAWASRCRTPAELRQEVLIGLTNVAPLDTAQGGVASKVVASIPVVFPVTRRASARRCKIHVKTA